MSEARSQTEQHQVFWGACPTCRYSLAGLTQDQNSHVTCPECGAKLRIAARQSLSPAQLAAARARRLQLRTRLIMAEARIFQALWLVVTIVIAALAAGQVLLHWRLLWFSIVVGITIAVVGFVASVLFARWLIRKGIAASAVERGECRRCLYDLTGLKPDDRGRVVCPECGEVESTPAGAPMR